MNYGQKLEQLGQVAQQRGVAYARSSAEYRESTFSEWQKAEAECAEALEALKMNLNPGDIIPSFPGLA